MDFSFISMFSTIRNSEENSEDSNIFEEIEECFSKIFYPDFKFIEEPEIKNISNSEIFQDKPVVPKEIPSKTKVENKSSKISFSFEETKNIANQMNKSKEPLIISLEQKKENDEKNEEFESLLGKKRLFIIENPNDFAIFRPGQSNINSNQLKFEILIDNSHINEKKNKEKKNTLKRKRKYNADNIRKKIKSKFLRNLLISVNSRLEKVGAKKLFKALSQVFISNVSKQINKEVWNLPLKEIFKKKFFKSTDNHETKDMINYQHNLRVLEYLEQNPDIGEKSNYNVFKDMKYYQIYNEYLNSKEFETSIRTLNEKKENTKYIKNYIFLANDFNKFYSD